MDTKELHEQMLRDLLDAVAHLYGPDGLGKVVSRMKLINRARDHRREIDALEAMMTEWRS